MARIPYFRIPKTVKKPILIWDGHKLEIRDAQIELAGFQRIRTERIRADFGAPVGVLTRDVRLYSIVDCAATECPWSHSTGNSSRPGPPSYTNKRRSVRRGRGRLMRGGKKIDFEFPSGAAIEIWRRFGLRIDANENKGR